MARLSVHDRQELLQSFKSSGLAQQAWCRTHGVNVHSLRYWLGQERKGCLTTAVYLHEYSSPKEARNRIAAFIECYNYFRPHQSLHGQTPGQVYRGVSPIGLTDILRKQSDIHLTNFKTVS